MPDVVSTRTRTSKTKVFATPWISCLSTWHNPDRPKKKVRLSLKLSLLECFTVEITRHGDAGMSG
jgi:hypothetical protein